MQKLLSVLLSGLLHICKMTVTASFWRMAFIAFLLRLFVVPPFGALLGLLLGIVWCLGNADHILSFAQTLRNRILS